MKRIQYCGLGALIILLTGTAVLWVQHERSEIQQLQQEAAEANKLLEEIEKEKETPKMVAIRSVGTGENDIEKVSGADIEKLAKEFTTEGKVSGADIETLLEWIGAEEEEVEKALSAEELRKREAKKRAKELFKEIGAIMKGAGGKIHSSTHPEEWRKISQLLQEASGGGATMFTQMNDFAMRFQNSVNSNGEMPVSEAIKMADYMESENGDTFSATALRNLVQYTVNNGDDVIKLNELHKIDISGKPTDNKTAK